MNNTTLVLDWFNKSNIWFIFNYLDLFALLNLKSVCRGANDAIRILMLKELPIM